MIKISFGKNYSKSYTMESDKLKVVKEILPKEDWKEFQKSFKHGFKIKVERV